MNSHSTSVERPGAPVSKERFLVLPIVILILAQMGTTGDNGALSLAASASRAILAPRPRTSSSPT